MTQPILYAHAVQSALGADGAASAYEAWLMHLDRGTMEAVTVTASDIATALGAQQTSLERMRDLLVDPTRNVPKPRGTFAQAVDPNRECRRCKMLALCSVEFNTQKEAA